MTTKAIDSARKWLKGYRLSVKEIQARTEHIEWLTSEVYAPLEESSCGSDSHAAQKVKKIMEDILNDAALRLAKLRYEVETIEKAIAELDHFESCILYNRYILGVQWLDLPEHIGYEIAQCQRIERKALTNLARLPRVQKFLYKDSSASVDKPVDNLTFSQSSTIV